MGPGHTRPSGVVGSVLVYFLGAQERALTQGRLFIFPLGDPSDFVIITRHNNAVFRPLCAACHGVSAFWTPSPTLVITLGLRVWDRIPSCWVDVAALTVGSSAVSMTPASPIRLCFSSVVQHRNNKICRSCQVKS